MHLLHRSALNPKSDLRSSLVLHNLELAFEFYNRFFAVEGDVEVV